MSSSSRLATAAPTALAPSATPVLRRMSSPSAALKTISTRSSALRILLFNSALLLTPASLALRPSPRGPRAAQPPTAASSPTSLLPLGM